MSKPRDDRQKDLLLPALDQIIDMGHPLVRLAALINWNILDERFSSVCQTGSGQPGLPTRLVAGLFILKHMHNLSDEVLCARWIEKRPPRKRPSFPVSSRDGGREQNGSRTTLFVVARRATSS
jgi:hypothetical protein